MTAGQLAMMLNQNIPDMTVSKVKDQNQTYDVVVQQEKTRIGRKKS